jgi:phosphoglycolate phosphatase-like HAD superfamily hydrolase
MQYASVLLDLDGTLIDSPKYWHAAYNIAVASFGKEITDAQFREWYPEGAHITHWLEWLGIGAEHLDTVRTVRDEHYLEHLRHDTKWLDGAKEFLESLKGSVPIGIITGSHRGYVDVLDKSLGVSDMVDLVLTCEDFTSKAHALEMCRDHFSVSLADSIYIGEQPFDEEGALGATTPFMVYKGEYTPQSLLDAGHSVITDWTKFRGNLQD